MHINENPTNVFVLQAKISSIRYFITTLRKEPRLESRKAFEVGESRTSKKSISSSLLLKLVFRVRASVY